MAAYVVWWWPSTIRRLCSLMVLPTNCAIQWFVHGCAGGGRPGPPLPRKGKKPIERLHASRRSLRNDGGLAGHDERINMAQVIAGGDLDGETAPSQIFREPQVECEEDARPLGAEGFHTALAQIDLDKSVVEHAGDTRSLGRPEIPRARIEQGKSIGGFVELDQHRGSVLIAQPQLHILQRAPG